jgi:hypothetical protein
MTDRVKNFWQKHPGLDAYSFFWFLLLLVLVGLGRFYLPLLIPAGVVLVYLLFRLFSHRQEKRQVENARFLALLRSVVRWWRRQKHTIQPTDKEYCYFKCPTCGQPMRVPRGLGRVQIHCRNCAAQFEFETKS